MAALGPVEQYEITGIATFGSVDSIGGATFAVFDVPTAQALFRKEGHFDSISIAAKQGTTPEQLVQKLEPLVPRLPRCRPVQPRPRRTRRRRTTTSGSSRTSCSGSAASRSSSAPSSSSTPCRSPSRSARASSPRCERSAARARQVLVSVVIEGFVIGLLASDRRPVPRARRREGAERALRRDRDRPAAGRHGLRDAHRRRQPDRRNDRHRARQHRAGAPGDPRAADLRRPRGLDAARVPLRAVRALRRARDHRPRDRLARCRSLRERARDAASSCCCSESGRSRSSSVSHSWRLGS